MFNLNLDLSGLFAPPAKQEVYEITLPYKPHPIQVSKILQPVKNWLYSKSKRALFLGFRKCGKSDIISVYLVSKWLAENPNRTVIIMTRKMDRAKSILRKIGDNLRMAGFSGEFGQEQIRLTNNRQPSVLALGVETSTKGWHADLLIMDDPVEPTDEYSVPLKRTVDLVYSESKNIATKIMVIGQYVAPDDIYTKIEKQKGIDKFTFWINEAPIDFIQKLELDIEDLKIDIKNYGKNYEGVFYPDDDNPFANYMTGCYGDSWDYGLIDPSNGKNDYTAFVYLKDYGDFVAIKGKMYYKKTWIKAIEEEKNQIDKLKKFYYEKNTIGELGFNFFKEFTKTPCMGFNTTQNKVNKILTIVPLFKTNKIRVDEASDKVFLDNLKNWSPKAGNNQIDDGIDALAMICQRLNIGNKKISMLL